MSIWRSLSGRLLVLTIVFVMLAEVLIFVPSVARFREEYLRERLEKAQIASLAALAAGSEMLPADLEEELVRNSEVFSVVLKRNGARELMLMSSMPMLVDTTYDLRDASAVTLIRDALVTFFVSEKTYVRVIGTPRFAGGESVEVVLDESALRRSMIDYGVRILNLSLFISALTAGAVFLSVTFFLVRPMGRVIDSIVAFREDPEDAARILSSSGASGEIGQAETELAAMQSEVRQALRQKSRLAALGEAVAKINHDLRNILASTQLLADRLESSKDPVVKRVAPKLIASLDRAIRLCRQTLDYGRADEPPPTRREIALQPLLEELSVALGVGAGESGAREGVNGAGPSPSPALTYAFEVDPALVVCADPDQLFRTLLNLSRNAMQAMEAAGDGGAVRIEARARDSVVEIDVVDNGPGLPPSAREHLFKPFKGSVRKGGTGLGLAIAAELVRGHGGDIALVSSDARGARFRLTLPNDTRLRDASPRGLNGPAPDAVEARAGESDALDRRVEGA